MQLVNLSAQLRRVVFCSDEDLLNQVGVVKKCQTGLYKFLYSFIE
jgi:hypothetical protein